MRAIHQSRNEQTFTGRTTRTSRQLKKVCSLVIETLEARQLLSVTPILVTNTNDSGTGSLRAAIVAANSNPGADEIDFQIASGPQVIHLASALPAITDTLTINGMTQPGYTGAPLVALDGASAGFVNGLDVQAPNCVIEGVAVYNFASEGIHLAASGTGATISHDYLGVMLDGQTPAANNDGLYVQSSGDTIAGNVLSGNNVDGVLFSGASNCTVTGNMVGLDQSGELVISNFNNGVEIADASSNITVSGNVISGNFGNGIFIDTSSGVTMTGNTIGLDASGMLNTDASFNSYGNSGNGVSIGFQSFNNVVGGTSSTDANVISNNSGGVRLFTYNPENNLVEGNIIGLGSDGKSLQGNSGDGVMIVGLGTPDFTISGAVITDNIIAGNFGNGITAKSGALITNNKIGIDAFGDSTVGNFGDGVRLLGSNSTVTQNTVWYNQFDGVSVGAGTGNLISQNSIFANDVSGQTAAGIDLFNGNFYLGPTPNDSAGHSGANNFQNFPIIVSVTNNGSNLVVSGTLDSTPATSFTLEFFSSAVAGPQGYGEGENYLGSAVVTSDGAGHVSFNVTLPEPAKDQTVLSATATDSGNNTSEFALSAAIPPAPVLTATTTSLTSSLNPSQLGQDVTLTATVSSTSATGTVTFLEGSNTLGTANVVNGVATLHITALAVGSHSISAVYSGDGSFPASTSPALSQLVTTIATTTSLSSSLNPSTVGADVTLTATLSATAATGTVTFMEGSTALGTANVVNGVAKLDLTTLGVGSHSITATYSGDNSYAVSSSAALTQVVTTIATTTTLTSSLNPSTYGQDVKLTATVSSTSATGTVTFSDGNTVLGTANVVNGVATFDTSALAVGSHSITAAYTGDSSYAGSSSAALTQVVTTIATTTTLTSSLNPSTYGQDVKLTATVSSTSATGTVTFSDGNTVLGTANVVNGVATFDTSALAVGSHSITAAYSGDASFAPSTSAAVSQVVNKIATTTMVSSSLNPSTFGQLVTFTAMVTSGATGTVTFMDGTTVLSTASLINGAASFTSASLSVGTHTITAVYSGDGNYAASTSTSLTQTVKSQLAATSTTLTSSGPSMSGQKMTFTAAVSSAFGVVTGTVTFMDGNTVLGTATIKNGVATFSISTLSVGTHTITAVYSGNATFQSSASAPLTVTVTPQPGKGHK